MTSPFPSTESPTLQSRAARPVRTYRGTLIVVALMGAGLTILLLLIWQAGSLIHEAENLATLPPLTLALFVALPVLAGTLTFLVGAHGITLLRISIYLGNLHNWTSDWLQLHAPLYHLRQAGLPGVTRGDVRGIPMGQGREDLRVITTAGTTALLIGSAGSGKSVALVGLAHDLSHQRLAFRVWLGKSPLPVLMTAHGVLSANESGFPPIAYCAREVARHASPGFSRYFPLFAKRKSVLFLCDGIHHLPQEQHPDVSDLLTQLLHRSGGRASLMATCDPASHLTSLSSLPAFSAWARYLLMPLRMPLGAMLSEASLKQHLLDESLAIPALAVALTELPSTDPLPWGVPHLLTVWRSIRWTAHVPEIQVNEAEQVLARLAAAMLQAQTQIVPIAPGESPASALHHWMVDHRTLQPARIRRSGPIRLSEQLAQQVLTAATAADILRVAVDGRSIGFAHGLIAASYAADWLISQDDDTLPLDGLILRPLVAPAFMHWAGRIERPFTLGQRTLSLRRGSTTVARQAGLSDQQPISHLALGLATLATCTGVAIRLAYSRREGGNTGQAIINTEGFMRDILDEALHTLNDPVQARAFTEPLRMLRSYLGPDADAAINSLAVERHLSTLTRAQLFNLLGALATPAALALLAESLPDNDPTLRAGVNHGFELAGSAAIPFLQEKMTSGDQKISARAREVLVSLGNTSIAASPTTLQTTLQTLSTTSGPERAASIQALGAINSPEAHDALLGALDDDDTLVRAAAISAIANRRDPASLPILRSRVSAPDPESRAALALGLANFRYPEQFDDLASLLASPDSQVRMAAAKALGMLGDERAIPLLERYRTDASPHTQAIVQAALRRLRGA